MAGRTQVPVEACKECGCPAVPNGTVEVDELGVHRRHGVTRGVRDNQRPDDLHDQGGSVRPPLVLIIKARKLIKPVPQPLEPNFMNKPNKMLINPKNIPNGNKP